VHNRTSHLLGFNASEFSYSTIKTILNGTSRPVVLDIGCNVGDFVSEVLSVNKKARFFCFDIDPFYESVLKQKFPESRIQYFTLGLSNRIGMTKLVKKNASDRKAYLVNESKKDSREDNSKFVKVSTLDQIFPSLRVTKVNVLKIDTEGQDFKVLLGGREVLRRTEVVVFEVMHRLLENGNQPQEIIEFLKNLGFSDFYRLSKYFGLQPLKEIFPWEVATQNIVASRGKLR
jgi:FkbM family methyltransferase